MVKISVKEAKDKISAIFMNVGVHWDEELHVATARLMLAG